MSVAVIFPRAVMFVIFPEGGDAFKPLPDVLEKSLLKVVYEDRSRYVHCGHEDETLGYAASPHDLPYRRSYVNELLFLVRVKPQILCMRFQDAPP